MDSARCTINCEKNIRILEEQAPIESAVPVPADKTLGAVLCVSPLLAVEQTAVTEGGVQVSGTLSLHIVAEDEERRLYCFDAAADFSHTLTGEGLAPGMQSQVQARLNACELRQEDGGLRLYAQLSLTAWITQTMPLEPLTGISGGRGVEQRTCSVCIKKKVLLGAKSMRLREEEGVEEGTVLLAAQGSLEPLKTELVGASAALEGALFLHALVLPPNGRLKTLTMRVPFTETIPVQGSQEMQPFSREEITGLQTMIRGEALLLEADISLSVYGIRQEEFSLLEDAYDADGTFSCETERMECLRYSESRQTELPVRTAVSIPAHLPESQETLYTCALPAVRKTENGILEGGLLVTLVYRCPQGLLHSFTQELPFSVTLMDGAASADAASPMLITAKVLSLKAYGTGRSINVDASLLLEGEIYTVGTLTYIQGLSPCTTPLGPKGLLLYFTQGGESFFALGKQFGLPVKEIRELNPEAEEPLPAGRQILLLK